MALTMGTGPFGPDAAGTFNFTRQGPAHVLYFEPVAKRIRTRLGEATVADSEATMLLHETGLPPVYYFPLADVRQDLLEATGHTSHCPFKGDATYWTVRVAGRTAENAVWGYPQPLDSAPPIRGYVAFYTDRMDAWLEEDEQVHGQPRDPYHRVEVLDASRRVRVSAAGQVIAESGRPKLLLETGLPPRLYLPAEDARAGVLVPSDTHTTCPYKGLASYWSAQVDGTLVDDAAWGYPRPLPMAVPVAGHVCFDDSKVEVEQTGRG
ncbi:MAG: DUF427 domain-containing protein [Euzebyales bacterium]|nr:DUF427 domain-containing protein [Euzebyales bacterium]